MEIPKSEFEDIVREEVKKVFLNELGPQHDFRKDPEERAREFIDFLGAELKGVVDAHISLDPVDRRSGRYKAVIEISKEDMKKSRLSPQELKRRVEGLASSGNDIVQKAQGADFFDPSRRHEFYGFEIPFLA